MNDSSHYKFQVLIHRTVNEGEVDLKSSAELSCLLEKIRKSSGYVLCPGLIDHDNIVKDVRVKLANVNEEVWPWQLVAAVKCKLSGHKPRNLLVT